MLIIKSQHMQVSVRKKKTQNINEFNSYIDRQRSSKPRAEFLTVLSLFHLVRIVYCIELPKIHTMNCIVIIFTII